jgi:hypothetical protein
MPTIQEDLHEFRRQLRHGATRRAYRALLDFMLALRTGYQQRCPDWGVSGLYQGYLDMTYFAIVPPALKRRALKIAIVFNYDAFRFEAWLAGSNRQVQRRVWELLKDSRWEAYRVVAPAPGIDSIVECDLAADFDLGDPAGLQAAIEQKAARFIAEMERTLAEHDPQG